MTSISNLLSVLVLLKCAKTQFDFSHYFSQQQQPTNFAFQGVAQNFYNQQMAPYLLNNFNYLEECSCECDRCYNPKQCCAEFCAKCTAARSLNGYYYYPYPYLVMPNMQTTTATITTTVTTTTVATTTVATTNALTEVASTIVTTNIEPAQGQGYYHSDDEVMEHFLRENSPKDIVFNPDPLNNDNSKLILSAMRRTKPRWMPKYGIVPIPDQIAEKLMLRIRQMKVLHPEEETIRRTDPLRP